MLFVYYCNHIKFINYQSTVYFDLTNLKILNNSFTINIFQSKKKFKKIYTKFLYHFLYQLKFKLKLFNSVKLNWRFFFISFHKILLRLKFYNTEYIEDQLEIYHNNLNYLIKFLQFYKKKKFVQFKNKFKLSQNIFFKKVFNSLIKFKSIVQSNFNQLKFYNFSLKKSNFIEFNIHIKIKKNNIFLIFKNATFKKLIFFVSSGRVFKGKKKRNYLAGRFLSKTLLRLIVRFLLKKKEFLNISYYFTINYDKLLKHFLIKSILNSIKYFKFPVLIFTNIYAIPHSSGVKLKKMRRL